MAWQISDELREAADVVCPPPPAAERIAFIKRKAALQIAEIEAEDGEAQRRTSLKATSEGAPAEAAAPFCFYSFRSLPTRRRGNSRVRRLGRATCT